MEAETVLEAIMLICFGVSWPASIYKSYTLKKVTGKSQIFLWLVFVGYIFGLLHKLVNNFVAPNGPQGLR